MKMSDLFRFIGEDGSMGLTHGNVYLVNLTVERHTAFYKAMPTARLPELSSNWKCPYQSWETFLENWERVK